MRLKENIMSIDLNYYKIVVETQNDPEILKSELSDLIREIKKYHRSKRSVQSQVSLLNEIKILSEWHIDYDADENNDSPDDQVAHINGLIYQKAKKVTELINTSNGAVSASPPTAGSAADAVETWSLIRDLRNALAAAMRTIAAGRTCDEFLAEAASAGVPDGIGQRSGAWLKRHSHNAPVRRDTPSSQMAGSASKEKA